MKVTIIYGHPWNGSYNGAILESIEKKFKKENKDYYLIDLNKDQFNPVMTKEDLALYNQGKSVDPLVKKYQSILMDTNELIIVSPIWWYELPSIVKGFFDKVMLKGFSYKEGTTGLKGLLTPINKATVITTATSPKWYLKFFGGNYIKKVLMGRILKDAGIKKTKWHHIGNVKGISKEKRTDFLVKLNTDVF